MGRRGIRGLKTRVSGSTTLAEGARLYSGDIQVGRVRGGGSHSVTNRDAALGAAPGMRAGKSSEFGEEKL